MIFWGKGSKSGFELLTRLIDVEMLLVKNVKRQCATLIHYINALPVSVGYFYYQTHSYAHSSNHF